MDAYPLAQDPSREQQGEGPDLGTLSAHMLPATSMFLTAKGRVTYTFLGEPVQTLGLYPGVSQAVILFITGMSAVT